MSQTAEQIKLERDLLLRSQSALLIEVKRLKGVNRRLRKSRKEYMDACKKMQEDMYR